MYDKSPSFIIEFIKEVRSFIKKSISEIQLQKEALEAEIRFVKMGVKKDDLEHIKKMIEENRLPPPENLQNTHDMMMSLGEILLESAIPEDTTVTEKSTCAKVK